MGLVINITKLKSLNNVVILLQHTSGKVIEVNAAGVDWVELLTQSYREKQWESDAARAELRAVKIGLEPTGYV